MLFCSIEFIFLFMPIFLLIYYTVPEKYGNLILFLGSLFFYAYGERKFFWLILVSLVLHYGLTRYAEGKSRECQRVCLILLLLYGFGMLFVFKYMDFFAANWNHLAVWLTDRGSSIQLPQVTVPKVSLPLGISFYTFQIAAYVIDVSSADRRSDCAVSRCGCTIKKTCSELAPYGKWHQDIYYRSESEDASG